MTGLGGSHATPSFLNGGGRSLGPDCHISGGFSYQTGQEVTTENLCLKSPSGKGNPNALGRKMPETRPPGWPLPLEPPLSLLLLKGAQTEAEESFCLSFPLDLSFSPSVGRASLGHR